MIKFIVNMGGPVLRSDKNDPIMDIELSGTIIDLMTDLTYGLATIYDRLKRSSPDDAEDFRLILAESVNDPNSPLWNIAPPPAEVDTVMLLPNPTKGGTL